MAELGDIQIIAVSGQVSPAEKDEELVKLLGVLAMRFNILETYLSNMLGLKMGIMLKGESYDYISEEMSFLQKIKLSSTYLPIEIKSRLTSINKKRNKILHGTFLQNHTTKEIKLRYKKEEIKNINKFTVSLNAEISGLSGEIHNIMIRPNKLR